MLSYLIYVFLNATASFYQLSHLFFTERERNEKLCAIFVIQS